MVDILPTRKNVLALLPLCFRIRGGISRSLSFSSSLSVRSECDQTRAYQLIMLLIDPNIRYRNLNISLQQVTNLSPHRRITMSRYTRQYQRDTSHAPLSPPKHRTFDVITWLVAWRVAVSSEEILALPSYIFIASRALLCCNLKRIGGGGFQRPCNKF